ncbi:flagellar biosynthesis anti-sigma factor FlgM [Pelomonas sp. CA6]|uniref:flagellar biosynthesis anti-sigma factor FlgM n=1 Tax=Pelomonas sp. CA6 TaxID=2907999 RepID=UPI001F4BCF49|nr:flagellar biosynthesis anti-sigma factor FlgM [Pelomonas sp. CA6]MCH7344006.1 flagellar biosynthesis anti-sigma factor FlgM [Pelomonas sp. CA6]
MKIGNSPELHAYKQLSNDRPASGQAGQARPGKTEAGTQVELSSTATHLVAGAKSDEGSFDAEKVKRISQAIADGKFTVNADAIADKLIANAQEMLGRAMPH